MRPKKITAKGQTKTLREWSETAPFVAPDNIRRRLRNNCPAELAVSVPTGKLFRRQSKWHTYSNMFSCKTRRTFEAQMDGLISRINKMMEDTSK